jgi:hypothetical protein
MSVLAQLERLDHRLTGRPEAEYVYESRKWRLRLSLIVLLTFVSLIIAVASTARLAGWFLVAFAVATFVKTFLARRAWRATAVQSSGSWLTR